MAVGWLDSNNFVDENPTIMWYCSEISSMLSRFAKKKFEPFFSRDFQMQLLCNACFHWLFFTCWCGIIFCFNVDMRNSSKIFCNILFCFYNLFTEHAKQLADDPSRYYFYNIGSLCELCDFGGDQKCHSKTVRQKSNILP